MSKGVLSQVQVLTKEEEQELNRKENDYKLPTPSGKRIFTIILVIILMFFGLAINLQNQAFIILMILILGFILICSSIGWLIKKLMNISLHTTKNQHQPIFMGLGVKKLTNCRNTALSLFNNTKRKPSINKSKPNANKLA